MDWHRTAHSMALTAELNRDRKKRSRPFSANDFNPFLEDEEKVTPVPKGSFKDLKAAFIRPKRKRK